VIDAGSRVVEKEQHDATLDEEGESAMNWPCCHQPSLIETLAKNGVLVDV
jgi:hypothetical protein